MFRLLDLSKVRYERLIGYHLLLSIVCDSCKVITKVNTAHITQNQISEVNAGIVLGK